MPVLIPVRKMRSFSARGLHVLVRPLTPFAPNQFASRNNLSDISGLILISPAVQSELPIDLPIHTAASEGDVATVREILDKDPSQMHKMGVWRLPINRAIAAGHPDVVECILDHGFPIDLEFDGSGSTPMHEAAVYGRGSIVKLLIARGADINRPNMHNYTPLLLASDEGFVSVVETLLTAGADPTVRNVYGRDAFDQACMRQGSEESRMAIQALTKVGRYHRLGVSAFLIQRLSYLVCYYV